MEKTDINDVVVCDQRFSCFPVMASGRKLVAVLATMSNPYISYIIRDNDRKQIMNALQSGNIGFEKNLLEKYFVKFILIENKEIANTEILKKNWGEPVFKNIKFSIYLNKLNN